MSLSLDDLGRAAWDAEWLCMLGHGVKRPSYDKVSRNDQQTTNAGALAAVERFAEEAIRELRTEADGYEEASIEDGLDRKALRDLEQLRMAAIAAAEKLGELVASLRAEAQKGNDRNGIPNRD